MSAHLLLDAGAAGWPVLVWSPELEELTGLGASELLGRPWPALWDEGEAAVAELHAALTARRAARTSLPTVRRGAEPVDTEVELSILAGERPLALLTIHPLAEAHRTTDWLAYHDHLTGLANRTLLERELRQALSRAGREGTEVAVLYLDLDRFKEINDEFGHPVGDDVLREVARRLRRGVRGHDLLGRVGGDEFVVVLPDLRADVGERAERVADHLRREIGVPLSVGEASVTLGVSIGIARQGGDGEDPIRLVAGADSEMYRRKQGTRGAPAAPEPDRWRNLLDRARQAQHRAGGLRERTMRTRATWYEARGRGREGEPPPGD